MNIKECVFSVVNKYNNFEIVLTMESNLFLDIGIDSLLFLELICEIEEFFKIEIKIEEISQCLIIGNLIKIVETKLKDVYND